MGRGRTGKPGPVGESRAATMPAVATHTIRVFGDPVLKRPTAEVTDIDGGLVKLVDAMYETMREAPGVGLAAPQVGVQKRFFVYEVPDETGPHVLLNPQVVVATGEWEYEEGCLSLPGLAFDIVRPKLVTVKAIDLDGNEVVIEGDELLGRIFLHEIDHLDGVLMLDRLDADQRKLAMRELREQGMGVRTPGGRTHAL
jgi:peptide deformylase